MKAKEPKNYRQPFFDTLHNVMTDRNEAEQPLTMPATPVVVDTDKAVAFAQRYTARGGTMYYCTSEPEICQQISRIRQQMAEGPIYCCNENLTAFLTQLNVADAVLASPAARMDVGVLLGDGLMADSGEIVLTSCQGLGTNFPTLPRVCIILSFTSQVVADQRAAMDRLMQMYKQYPADVYVLEPRQAGQGREVDIHLILIEDQ